MTNPHVPYERKFLKLKNLFERSTRAVVINFFKYCIFIIFQVPVVQFFHSKLGKHAQKLHKKHQKKNRLNPCFALPLWPTRTPFAQRWRKHSFQLVKPLRSDVTFEQTLKLLAMQRHGSVALYQYQTPKKRVSGEIKFVCVFCPSCSTMFLKKRCRAGCTEVHFFEQPFLRSCRAEIYL